MRMLLAWFVIWPKAELPNAVLAGAAHCTSLNRFSTSIRIDAACWPDVWNCLLTEMSTLFRIGDSTPGSVRGALPNWFAATAENAAGFRYTLSFVFDVMRSVMSPDVRKSAPVTFGRGLPPNRNGVVVWFCVTPIGKPLCTVMTVVADQPPST